MQNIYIANYNDLKIYFNSQHATQKYALRVWYHTVLHSTMYSLLIYNIRTVEANYMVHTNATRSHSLRKITLSM